MSIMALCTTQMPKKYIKVEVPENMAELVTVAAKSKGITPARFLEAAIRAKADSFLQRTNEIQDAVPGASQARWAHDPT